jgi:hypothetical protein
MDSKTLPTPMVRRLNTPVYGSLVTPWTAITESCADATILYEIEITLSEAEISEHEWFEQGKGYRKWLIPARILNAGKITRCTDEGTGQGN